MASNVAAAEGKKKYDIKESDVKTYPFDARFPVTNQTRHCFFKYVEYHKCIQEHGDGDPKCDKYLKCFRAICPIQWVEAWDEQRENGVFPGQY